MNRRQKLLNWMLALSVFAWTVWQAATTFQTSYLRMGEAFRDFGLSIKFFFCLLLGIPNYTMPTVNNFSDVMPWRLIPEEWVAFWARVKDYFTLLFRGRNLKAYGEAFMGVTETIAKAGLVLLPCVLILAVAMKQLYRSSNTKHNHDTVPLVLFKRYAQAYYQPVKRFVLGYIAFIKEHIFLVVILSLIWVCSLNLVTIVVEFLAYYFFFAVSYRLDTLYIQFGKLLVDLLVIYHHVPAWILLIIPCALFLNFRKTVALAKLRHMEARNCGFINELPIVSMTCGSMGKRKTTMITDMALSQEVMFRQKALDILQKNDMKFPYFPWVCFEMELRRCMEFGTVYNLATVKAWVRLKQKRYEKHGDSHLQLYGYDTERYGMSYENGLTRADLFDVLETYAQAYFIYVMQSSLIISNYSIRTDNRLLDAGNFPMWSFDFFRFDYGKNSRYAHILDFDVLRLGKKVVENNEKAGSFEFGVVAITEVGKERGNNLELKEVRKGQDETNQKNDLFNAWLKMCRHSATVDHFPFIKVFTDEQRPESWGADARDLADILHIVSSGEQRLALPFFTIEEMVQEWLFGRFTALYYDFRHRRGDNTLLVHILKSVTAVIYRYYVTTYNRYGYSITKIEKERGTQDGNVEKKKYYLMNQKIYANRFSTDCFSDYFNDMAKKSKMGLHDYVTYQTEKATVEELKMQNSYFINSLYKGTGNP